MSRQISRTGLLIALAFTVPLVVELRTVAAFAGVDLSTTQYLAVAAAVVVGVVVAVGAWNLAVADDPACDRSEGV